MGRRRTGSAARDRLLAEARTLASVHHPNIAIIHSLEEHASGHFLTMERIEGRSLSERLREGSLPLEEALAVARQVARALEASHAKGMVHRDLKPSNVMLCGDGTAKVLDFGIAPPRRGVVRECVTARAAGTQLSLEDALARAASLLAIDPQARPTTAAVEAPPSR